MRIFGSAGQYVYAPYITEQIKQHDQINIDHKTNAYKDVYKTK